MEHKNLKLEITTIPLDKKAYAVFRQAKRITIFVSHNLPL